MNYLYSADGVKLRTEMSGAAGSITEDCCSNVVYRNGAADRIMVPGGYIRNGEYLFFVTHRLGSIRAVADSAGNVLQTLDYYPDGQDCADYQPYRFNGKESQEFAGLPYLDYGARFYHTLSARWTTPDPLAEKYCAISPYAFCAGNPVNFVDPYGKRIFDENGKLITYSPESGWSDNVTNEQKELFVGLQRTKSGAKLIDDIMKSTVAVTVDFTDDILLNDEGRIKSGQNTLISRNGVPIRAKVLLSISGMAHNNSTSKTYRNVPWSIYKTMVLAHEFQHTFNTFEYNEITDPKERNREIEADSKAKMEEYLKETNYLPTLNTLCLPKYL